MNKTHPGRDSAVAEAQRELSQLRQQSVEARATLTRLRWDVVEATGPLAGSQSALLIEANEELVAAAMHARSAADACSLAFEELSRSAALDALTALPNRARLLVRFSGALAFAKRHGTRMALLFLDLNNFKEVNDAHGHAVGDEVLKLVAHRMASLVRDEDMVCRYGGDEFLILLTEVSQASDATLVADKLIAALDAPCCVGQHVFRLSACIGICICPDDGDDMHALIECADAAMYRAKRQQGSGSSVAIHGAGPVAGRPPQSPGLGSLQHPSTQDPGASAAHERQHAQLREANSELVLAALDAQQLQAAAERAQRQQKESLALVAHELRNPLTPIRFATEMLGLVRPEEMSRYQAIIESEVEHMVRLISDLLDMSRVNTGKLRIECRLVDLAGVIEEAANACRPAMDARLQRFNVAAPERAIALDADPVRLAQILRNLLDNASKYTPKGGEIGLSVAVVGETVVISVSDNGIGITNAVLPNVFEPFVQDLHAIGFNGAGMGIGLTVVRELVGAHGGSVEASSAGAGLGSQFVVTLPLAGSGRETRCSVDVPQRVTRPGGCIGQTAIK